MITNNLFADYLFDQESQDIYDMLDTEKAFAFTDFFLHPLYKINEDGQEQVMEVICPIFYAEKGNYKYVRNDFVASCNYYDTQNPGSLVWYDLTADYKPPYVWYSDRTFKLLHEFEIQIVCGEVCYTFALHSFSDGFLRYGFSWERFGWYEGWQKPHVMKY